MFCTSKGARSSVKTHIISNRQRGIKLMVRSVNPWRCKKFKNSSQRKQNLRPFTSHIFSLANSPLNSPGYFLWSQIIKCGKKQGLSTSKEINLRWLTNHVFFEIYFLMKGVKYLDPPQTAVNTGVVKKSTGELLIGLFETLIKCYVGGRIFMSAETGDRRDGWRAAAGRALLCIHQDLLTSIWLHPTRIPKVNALSFFFGHARITDWMNEVDDAVNTELVLQSRVRSRLGHLIAPDVDSDSQGTKRLSNSYHTYL